MNMDPGGGGGDGDDAITDLGLMSVDPERKLKEEQKRAKNCPFYFACFWLRSQE